MNQETLKFRSARIMQQKEVLRSHFDVARDIVRFMRDDASMRSNHSALLMYLEKKLVDMLGPLDTIYREAAEIYESDMNEPEDLPF